MTAGEKQPEKPEDLKLPVRFVPVKNASFGFIASGDDCIASAIDRDLGDYLAHCINSHDKLRKVEQAAREADYILKLMIERYGHIGASKVVKERLESAINQSPV